MPNSIAILYFHQGWTDIFNCLALIKWYQPQFEKVYTVMREDARPLFDFFIRNTNIKPLYVAHEYVNHTHTTFNPVNLLDNENNNDLPTEQISTLFHGYCDIFQKDDNYKNRFDKEICIHGVFFVQSFYSGYNIPYMTRVNDFTFDRDHCLENETYLRFIEKYGETYILHHNVPENSNIISTEHPYVNLNGSTQIFFDYIKILEKSQEIHVIDSSWSAFIYLLDAKYRLFKDKKIYVYCNYGYYEMFKEPFGLDNWILI